MNSGGGERRAEHWPNCNMALVAEIRFIDKLLVSRSGVAPDKGSFREVGKKHIFSFLARMGKSDYIWHPMVTGVSLILRILPDR